MGMVYRAHDEHLDREVAVKTLTLEGTLDGESRRRFEIEARAAARLQHPNILTVYELGEDRGVAFIAMELLPGADLESVMRSPLPLTLPEALEVVIQVARGLAYAHEHGIVHRDIKPTNVRILDDGSVKIMDFGIAKLGGMNLTKSGMMLGTLYYMSPEQIQAKPLDGRSDVFSLGVILHELLAGRRPFSGENTTQVLFRIVHEDAAPLRVEQGAVSAALEGIVARALARDPAQRFTSALAFADALAEALAVYRREHPEAASADALAARRRERTLRRAVRAVEVDAYSELDATFQSPPTRQAPASEAAPATMARGLVLGGAALLLVGVGLAVSLWRGAGPAAATAVTEDRQAPVVASGAPAAPAPASVRAPSGLAAPAPGIVKVRSSYPIDVSWRGRVFATGSTSAEVQVPPGRQSLGLVAPSHFLRRTVTVDVTAGATTTVEAPALGRLSIKASPDNCEISIDGAFADYPPILDRAVAAGAHTIAFKWPDGTRREESVEIAPGRPAYVTGRKD